MATPGLLTIGGGETFVTAGFNLDEIKTQDRFCVGWTFPTGAFGNGAYPLANLATYTPLWLPVSMTIDTVLTVNNTTAPVSGNFDFGIYKASDFTLVVSTGATALTGAASARQLYAITSTVLPPGAYYMAVSKDSTTPNFQNITLTSSSTWRLLGMAWQESAYPLPSTMVPVRTTTRNALLLNVGIRRVGAL